MKYNHCSNLSLKRKTHADDDLSMNNQFQLDKVEIYYYYLYIVLSPIFFYKMLLSYCVPFFLYYSLKSLRSFSVEQTILYVMSRLTGSHQLNLFITWRTSLLNNCFKMHTSSTVGPRLQRHLHFKDQSCVEIKGRF